MSLDEEYVRAHWEHVFAHEADEDGGYVAVDLLCFIYFTTPDQPSAWSAAAAFTRERLEQIEEIVEEIAILTSISLSPSNISAVRRCIKRAESALDELKRGMK